LVSPAVRAATRTGRCAGLPPRKADRGFPREEGAAHKAVTAAGAPAAAWVAEDAEHGLATDGMRPIELRFEHRCFS
jgi:hypothetical protein